MTGEKVISVYSENMPKTIRHIKYITYYFVIPLTIILILGDNDDYEKFLCEILYGTLKRRMMGI